MTHAPSPDLDAAREVLRSSFGYDNFRTSQLGAISAVLSGRDALIVLPTGGGKSVCFQVPALMRTGVTVVVSPLISLMTDQVQVLQARGIAAEYLNSTLLPDEFARRLARLRAGDVKLLYVAPERLAIGHTLELLRTMAVSLLVIDEAHCVSEWGHDFRPSYLGLRAARHALGSPQVVALTATATPSVRSDIRQLLGLRAPMDIVSGFDRPNLRYGVEQVANEARRQEAMLQTLGHHRGSVVVYAATRCQVEKVTTLLTRRRYPAIGYHGGMPSERRARAQDAFMRGEIPIIVATNAFGMGIDKPDVRLVLHYATSGSLEDYYQEAGRAGRDGAPSRCVVLFHPCDRFVHERFRDASHPRPELVRCVVAALTSVRGSHGRVALDAVRVAAECRPHARVDAVHRAFSSLEQAGVLHLQPNDGVVRLRLLASPLRLACEDGALTAGARRVIACVAAADPTRCEIVPGDVGLRPFELDAAIRELESRQLVYAQRPMAMGILDIGLRSRQALERQLQHLSRLRRSDRAKLDAITGYASTTRCRRAYILRYFGDQSARERCGRCDNCDD